ncbi:MAG: GNAT family N-acetyltransferase [Anaerolineae bacterium]|nr:GNAT family N-acetyltransferase [Anaerolineae bacterium]
MATNIEIRKVATAQELRAFIEFPWTLYKNDPNWIPPLVSMRRDVLDKKRNPAWEYLDGDYFCAWRNGQLIGTVAAFINQRHNEYHDEQIGWFGAFETIEDEHVAQKLLDTAADWVRAKGYTTIRGPQTLTTHEEVGLLIDGFTPPVLQMVYNPPYYRSFIEDAGFQKSMDMYSFFLSSDQAAEGGLNGRLMRIAQSIMKRNKITIRQANPRNMRSEFELIKDIYNSAWEKNWGFVPLTERELDMVVEALGMIVDPRMLFFASVEDEPAGFILAVPDMNQVFQRVRPRPGVPELLSLLQVVWHWKVRHVVDGVRVPLMGVKTKYRGRGVDAVMYSHILESVINCGYKNSDSGWILATNEAMVSIAKNFGSQIYKTYRLYEKAL